jgi:biotin carboxyl carrier protein
MKYYATIDEQTLEIEIGSDGSVMVNGEPMRIATTPVTENITALILNNHSYNAVVVSAEKDTYDVIIGGEAHTVLVQDQLTYRVAQAKQAAEASMGEVTVKSPMPGLIIAVPITAGQAVEKGQTLVILESMKMENELKSPRAGVVIKVETTAGASVEKGQKLVTVGDVE